MATGVVLSVGALLVEGVVGVFDTGKGVVFLTLEVVLVAGKGDIGVLADAAGRLLVVGASLRDVAGSLLVTWYWWSVEMPDCPLFCCV